MTAARPLSGAFLRGAALTGLAPDPESAPTLEHTLETLVARAAQTWPDVRVDSLVFAEFLGVRVPVADLAQARAEDLWIACASARGDRAALAVIGTRYFPDIDGALGKMSLGADRIAEVKQGLRRLLFVGDGDTPPRIEEFRGSGDLRAWMRVTAMRAALKLIRKDGREVRSDDALLEAHAPTDDPELAYMKASYRAAFKSAFQEALESLQSRERTLLKQQIVDGLGIDELGALYDVHRATAARWVAAAREKLLLRTRRAFMVRARISSDECESVMRLVRSQLDISLHRRLAAN